MNFSSLFFANLLIISKFLNSAVGMHDVGEVWTCAGMRAALMKYLCFFPVRRHYVQTCIQAHMTPD